MAEAETTEQQLDTQLLAYLHAYEEFMTSHIELQSALREGHIAIAHARRDLSRTYNTGIPQVSSLQYPSEMDASFVLQRCEPENSNGVCTYEYVVNELGVPKSREVSRNDRSKPQQNGDSEPKIADLLSELGVNDDVRGAIARSVENSEDIAMVCGDRLVVEVAAPLHTSAHPPHSHAVDRVDRAWEPSTCAHRSRALLLELPASIRPYTKLVCQLTSMQIASHGIERHSATIPCDGSPLYLHHRCARGRVTFDGLRSRLSIWPTLSSEWSSTGFSMRTCV